MPLKHIKSRLNKNSIFALLILGVILITALSAYGLGLSWGETANYILKETVAWKGSNNMPTADVDRDPRAWFSMTKWF